MRIVLDTNVFVSSLLTEGGLPDRLYRSWDADMFSLVTSRQQLAEFKRVTSYPHLQRFMRLTALQTMENGIESRALILTDLPSVSYSPDPDDNVILATAIAGDADYLVSGDKKGLLLLGEVESIPILTVRDALDLIA